MQPNEPQAGPCRVAVPDTAPSPRPTTLRTAAAAAGACIVLLIAVVTLRGDALVAATLLAALAGGVGWTITWVIDMHHVRAAQIAMLCAVVTTTVTTALGLLVTELGPAVVPVVGVLAVGTSVVVGLVTRSALSRGAQGQAGERVSWQARAAVGIRRVRRTKRFYSDPRAMRAMLPRRQDPRRCQPPAWLRRALDVEESQVDGCECWTLRPRGGARTGMHVLHLHGGGFVEHVEHHHWWFARRIVETLGCSLTFPMYPLAPAHGRHTITAMTRHSYDRFLGPCAPCDRVLIGDSAGAGLALIVAQSLRDDDEPQPSRLVLISPWLDLAVDDPLAEQIEPDDPALGIEGLRQAGRWFADDSAPDDHAVSPARGDLTGLAPTAVFIGTRDLLLADARMLQRNAANVGFPIAMYEYPGMFHNWIMERMPEAWRARSEMVHFLRAPDHGPAVPSRGGLTAGRSA